MGPLIFFVIIIVADLVLKSSKNKKRMQKAQERQMEEFEKKKDTITADKTEDRVKREIPTNPSLFKAQKKGHKKDDFSGEGGSYRDDHEGYKDRYEERYGSMKEKYEDIQEDYKKVSYKPEKHKNEGLYDKHAIDPRESKFDDSDIRNYGRKEGKIDIPIPKASTFKKDVFNGVIFSEILAKPKSMQKKDI